MVEVILKQEVRALGDRGELVRVAPGYARNYLFPRNLAMPATAANRKQLDEMQAAAKRETARLRSDAEQTAGQMGDVTIRIVARAGDSGQLFGSVTTRDIATELEKQGHSVDRQKIILPKPLKEVGDYDVRVHLYRDVNVTVHVEVRAEGREDEAFIQPELTEQEKIFAEPPPRTEVPEAEAAEPAEAEASAAAEGSEAETSPAVEAAEDLEDEEKLS